MAHQPLHKALARSGTVAYLLAHHEHLVAQGVFKGQQAASVVFMYLCKHPGAQRPGGDQEARWKCPVDALDPDHNKLTTIAKYAGLDVSNVRRALNWLHAQGLIHVDRPVGGEGKRMGYGPITILSTNWLSDLDRRNEETRRKLEQARTASNHHASPAKMHSASNKRTPPLIDDTPAPARPRRTVAGTRSSCGNTDGSEPPATIEAPPQGVRMGAGEDIPDAPDARPVGAPGGCEHEEAGPSSTSHTATADSPPSPYTGDDIGSSHHDVARTSGRKPTEYAKRTRVRAYHDGLQPDDLHDSVAADGLTESPGFPSGDRAGDRMDLDAFRFRLYRDTGQRAHRDSRQDSRMAMA